MPSDSLTMALLDWEAEREYVGRLELEAEGNWALKAQLAEAIDRMDAAMCEVERLEALAKASTR